MDSLLDSPRRRPKGDKRARTRARLIEAARELVREVGYERATLDAIARRAGVTTGAIYGNFNSRDELFLALGQTYWPAIKPRVRAGATLAEMMGALAEATLAAVDKRRAAAVGRLTGMAYTLTREALQAEVREATAVSYARGAAWLRAVADAQSLPMPAEQLVVVVHALSEGLLFQRFLTPELVPDEVVYAAFAALAGVKGSGPAR